MTTPLVGFIYQALIPMTSKYHNLLVWFSNLQDKRGIHLPGQEPRPITGNLTLCVGRVELVNYEIEEEYGQNTQDDPIDLTAVYDAIPESDTVAIREITDKYNWLNTDSRWVVVSGRSGSITTVPNSFVNPDTSNLRDIHDDNRFGIDEQLLIALQNAPTRTSAGGRINDAN